MKTALAAAGAVLALVLIWAVASYNGLVGSQEGVNKAWADVQASYQRRLDLIPNLVETVKGAANFEKSTLSAVVEARSKVGSFTVDSSVLNDPAKLKQFDAAQGDLGRALSRLMVVVEKYPDLKASQNFRDLQVQLEGTENRITVARRDFNEAVLSYNAGIRRLPGALIARLAGFTARAYFEAAPEAAKAPAVKF